MYINTKDVAAGGRGDTTPSGLAVLRTLHIAARRREASVMVMAVVAVLTVQRRRDCGARDDDSAWSVRKVVRRGGHPFTRRGDDDVSTATTAALR